MKTQRNAKGIRRVRASIAENAGWSLSLMLILFLLILAGPAVQAQETEQADNTAQAEDTETAQPTEDQGEAEVFTEEIVVTGQRRAIMSAQEVKLEAPQILDSIVATDIDKLPDRSVTEALQRIPGVTITHFKTLGDPEHFSAEGSGVMVRGLTMVRSELNGRDSFTADGGRSLSFQDVPPELMQRVDVYKNQTADLIEGGVGGSIDLVTKKPFDYDGLEVAATVEGNYGDFIEETNPSASVLLSNRWKTGNGEVGVLLDVAYSKAATRTDGVYARAFFPRSDLFAGETVYIPRGADWRSYTFDRERQGVYGVVQWKANPTTEMSFQVFNSQYTEHWDEFSIFVDNWYPEIIPAAGSTWTLDANNRFLAGRLDSSSASGGIPMGIATRFQDRDSDVTDFSYNLNWRPNYKWEIDFDLQRVDGASSGLDSTVASGLELPYLDVDLTGSRPQMSSDINYLSNPTNYYMAFTMDNRRDNDATENALAIDANYHPENEVLQNIKFGMRMTDTDSENHDTSYDWQPIYQTWMRWWAIDGSGPLPAAELEYLTLVDLPNFYRGTGAHPGVFMAPTMNLAEGFPQTFLDLHQDAADSGNYWCCYGPITIRDINSPQFSNIQNEKTKALYTMAEFGWYNLQYPVSGNIGVRYVETDVSTDGWVVYPSTITDTEGNMGFYHDPEQIGVENDYSNVLPSFNLRVNLRDNLLLRFAASRAMSRPAFNDLQSYRILSAALPAGVSLDDGPALSDFQLTADLYDNPALEAVEADQLDLSLEWYFDEYGGMAHANLFHKSVDGLISRAYTQEEYDGYTYTITQPTNNGSGSLQGFELGLKKFFDEIKALRGLGIDITYTYIDSNLSLEDASMPLDTDLSGFGPLPFIGISDNAYNATLIYERGPFSTRVAYNWRSKFLMGVGQNGFNGGLATGETWRLPVYTDDYGQLDASIQYKITDNLFFSLMGINLSNAETVLIADQNAAGAHTSSYVNDTTYIARLSVNLKH